MKKIKNIKEIFTKNFYSVASEEGLSNERLQTLNYLYQPILSKNSFLLYNFLQNEKKFVRNVEKFLSFSRFNFFLNFSYEDLEDAILELQKINLLDFQINFENLIIENQKCLFILKKPLLSHQFLKKDLIIEYKNKMNQIFTKEKSENFFDQIYYYFRPLFKYETKKNDNFISLTKIENKKQKWINTLFSSSEILNTWYKTLKIKDYEMLLFLKNTLKLDEKIIKLILEFSILKIEKFSCNYLQQTIKTLQFKNILNDIEAIENYFRKIYQNLHWKESVKFKNWLPQKKLSKDLYNLLDKKNKIEKNENIKIKNEEEISYDLISLKKIFQ